MMELKLISINQETDEFVFKLANFEISAVAIIVKLLSLTATFVWFIAGHHIPHVNQFGLSVP